MKIPYFIAKGFRGSVYAEPTRTPADAKRRGKASAGEIECKIECGRLLYRIYELGKGYEWVEARED